MKKALTLLTTGLFTLSLFSQTSRGQFLLGAGIASASTTNSESTTTYSNTPTVYKSKGTNTSYSIYPTIGWFLMDNFAVGGYFSYSNYHSNSTSSNTGSSTTTESDYTSPSLYIGPFARMYFGGGDKGKAFAHASYQWGSSGGKSTSKTSTGASSETKTIPKGYSYITGGIGYEQFLSNMVGLYFMAAYNISNSKTSYEYRPSTGTGYDYTSEYKSTYISLNIGVQVHLNPPKTKK